MASPILLHGFADPAVWQHYCPEVASIAKAFSKDFESKTLKGFTPEEFVELTYEELLDAETNRRVRALQLNLSGLLSGALRR